MRPRPKAVRKAEDRGGLPDNIASLLERKDSAAAAELAGIAQSSDRAQAKAAKRALFLLSQSGIQLPDPRPETRNPRPEMRMADRALMSNDGGTGSRMLWFMREDAYGGSPTVITILVNDKEGVVDLAQKKTPRRELDERIKDLKQRENTVIAEVPVDYARHALHVAERRNQENRTPLPQGYGDAFRYIGPPENEYTSPPVYDAFNADSVRNDESIPRAPEKLFEQPWFEGWLLDFEAVEPWEAKYFEAVSSRVLIDEAQRARRGDTVIDEAADSLLNAESISRYRRRLEDTAYVLHLAGHTEEARQALFHALLCDESAKPRTIPFLRTLVHRSIYLVIAYKAQLEEQAEQQRKQSGIIHPA